MMALAQVVTLVTLLSMLAPGATLDPGVAEDYVLLAKLIHYEARGEPALGQVAVGAVVMNRIKSNEFPNTVEEVIFQDGQFPGFREFMESVEIEPSSITLESAAKAMMGEDPTRGALYFHNP